MSLWTELWGRGKTVDKVVEAGIDGIDAAFYTSEEEARDSISRAQMALEFLKALPNASIARRLIALLIVGFWMFVGLDYVFLVNYASFVCIPGDFTAAAHACAPLYAADRINQFMVDAVKEPVNWILGFYFLAHVVTGLASKKESK